MQCDGCGAIGTGLIRAGSVKSCNLPAKWDRGHLLHAPCEALFSAYDISEVQQ